MIQKIEIHGIHVDMGDDIKRYITRKIGKLDRYMPRRAREAAHAEVRMKESTVKKKKQYTCEVVLRLPRETITTKETTINMFAAVDIVETKLKNQLRRYKDQQSVLRGRTRRLINKIRSRS